MAMSACDGDAIRTGGRARGYLSKTAEPKSLLVPPRWLKVANRPEAPALAGRGGSLDAEGW